jgi:hypothetical protein
MKEERRSSSLLGKEPEEVDICIMKEKLSATNFYKHPRFWRHAFMWLASLAFLIVIIVLSEAQADEVAIAELDSEEGRNKAIFVFSIFAIECLVLVYGSFYAYNVFYPKRKFRQLAVALIMIVVVMATVDHFIHSLTIKLGETDGFLANLVVYPIILFVAFGFKLGWHGLNQLIIIEKLKTKQVESELDLLKSQINPHFLFNTLNNIYSTNLHDHEKANEIILELSDLLRYQLESNKKDKVLLEEEIKSLDNYIELEKIRVRSCEVNVRKSGDLSQAKILPLLLIPFVENAFKYGTGIEKGLIDISYTMIGKSEFQFQCVNKIVTTNEKLHSGGIGLENVSKRLELMYPNKYSLDILKENGTFDVNLKIQL